MNCQSLIAYELPSLLLNDSGTKAMSLMNEFRIFHLPLVDRDNYIALVSEDDLLDWDTPEDPLSLAEFLNFRPMASANMHPFEAMQLMQEFNLSVIPVLDAHQHFLGAITIEKLISYFSETSAIKEPGAIIVLEMEQRNYSVSEIARICESNDVSILNLSVNTIDANGLQAVTIKVNAQDIQALQATFERYGYTITEVYAANSHSEDLQNNFDAFMNYMNL